MGVTEQIVFPEIDYDKIDKIRGLDISITTTAKTDDQGRALLKAFNSLCGKQAKPQRQINLWLKISMINRELKRAKTVAKYAAKNELR